MWTFAPCDEASETAKERARAAQTEKSVPTTIVLRRGGDFFPAHVVPPVRA